MNKIISDRKKRISSHNIIKGFNLLLFRNYKNVIFFMKFAKTFRGKCTYILHPKKAFQIKILIGNNDSNIGNFLILSYN